MFQRIDPSQIEALGYRFPAADSVKAILLQSKEWPDYPARRGSCSLLTRNNKFWAICTRHQLDVQFGSERTLSSDSSPLFSFADKLSNIVNVPTVRCLFATDLETEQEYRDILIFEIELATVVEMNLEQSFFPLNHLVNSKRVQSLAIGQPSDVGKLTYDPLEVEFANLILPCEIDETFATSTRFLKRFQYSNADFNKLDGLSGGTIFSWFENGEIHFEGTITRAGNGNIYCISQGFVAGIIDRA